jgi:broad specificity phosphatase PhoE
VIDLFFVRHGEAAQSWGQHVDPGLSELGRSQSAETAQLLNGVAPVDTVLMSSPKLRAQETAQPFAELRSAPVIIADVFREVPSVTDLENRQAWLRGLMRGTWRDVNEPEVLAWREGVISAVACLGHHTAVFSHFMVLNVLIGHIRGSDAVLQYWPANGSVTRCRLADGEVQLVELGAQMSTVVN